jgi:hypothetical protein
MGLRDGGRGVRAGARGGVLATAEMGGVMATGYRVQTREDGGLWRTIRTWPGEAAAKEDARLLGAQSREIDGVRRHGKTLSIPTYPYVKVLHGRDTLLDITPASRERVA